MDGYNADEWMKRVVTTNGTSRWLEHARMYFIGRSILSTCQSNFRSDRAEFRLYEHSGLNLVNTDI